MRIIAKNCCIEDLLAGAKTYRAFGVEYSRILLPDKSEFYLTSWGIRLASFIDPANWYYDEKYSENGNRLTGTGCAYRVKVKENNGSARQRDIVVKFCRFGEGVPISAGAMPPYVREAWVWSARWNGPFEEFGRVMELRRGTFGPQAIHIATQLPLGIFVPTEKTPLSSTLSCKSEDTLVHSMTAHQKDSKSHNSGDGLANCFESPALDPERDYIMVYSWVRGIDAFAAQKANLLTPDETHQLTQETLDMLVSKGFGESDFKPEHIIVRTDRRGNIVRRGGTPLRAKIDNELVFMTPEHQKYHALTRRRSYWRMINDRFNPQSAENTPSHLHHIEIHGMPYVYGRTPNGGLLFVLGYNHCLFDYYVPERWRGGARELLSTAGRECYHSLTEDAIHLVHRQSRAGLVPECSPEHPNELHLEHGYNSPFEEIFYAEILRSKGISTVYPRAVYRSHQHSTPSRGMHDPRRHGLMESLHLPDDESSILFSPNYHHIILWGYWRGIDPEKGYNPARPESHWGLTTMFQAVNDKLLDCNEAATLLENTSARLQKKHLDGLFDPQQDYLLSFTEDRQALVRNADGLPSVTLTINTLMAWRMNLLKTKQYHQIVDETRNEITHAGFDMLNLCGKYLLLSMNPDGDFVRDTSCRMARTICNFELIRPLGARRYPDWFGPLNPAVDTPDRYLTRNPSP